MPLKLENGLKKYIRNVARIKCRFSELVVILFTFNKKCDYVIHLTGFSLFLMTGSVTLGCNSDLKELEVSIL